MQTDTINQMIQVFEGIINAMTPKQYSDAIEKIGLSQRAAAKFLGVDERTSRRWALGEVSIPESVGKLLRLMIKLKLDPNEVT